MHGRDASYGQEIQSEWAAPQQDSRAPASLPGDRSQSLTALGILDELARLPLQLGQDGAGRRAHAWRPPRHEMQNAKMTEAATGAVQQACVTGSHEMPGGAMKLEIVQVPDCPNAAVLAARISELAHDRPGVQITHQVVTTEEDAERLGMTGSPTLLADGADPFARPGQKPSISCRLYRDEQGRPGPAPSLRQLRAALHLTDP